MTKRVLFASLMVLALTLPASAVPFCQGSGRPGVNFSFGFTIGRFTQDDRNNFNLMELRRRGVDAASVEDWNGCIRAYVRRPGGGQEMQFFDPDTFERVY